MTTPLEDAVATVRACIDRHADSDLPAAEVARLVVEEMRSDHRGEFVAYLEVHAVAFLTEVVRTIDRSARARARQVASRSVFAENPQSWLATRFSVGGGRPRLGSMTKAQLLEVAAGYLRTSRSIALEAAFAQALADKMPDEGTVEEILSDEDIQAIRASVAP